MSRELDDAILSLRTNELELGLWILKTTGSFEAVVAIDRQIVEHQGHWFVREVLGMMRRTFARLDVSSRSIYAVVEPASCFAGSLLELALAADRVYMLDVAEDQGAPSVMLSEMNFGALPMVNQLSRLAARFHQASETLDSVACPRWRSTGSSRGVGAGSDHFCAGRAGLGRRTAPGD